jgi:ATP-dependent helicase/nuclease subunit A
MLANWPTPEQGVDHTGRLVDALITAAGASRTAVEDLAATGAKVPKNMQDGAGELQDLLRAFRSDSWNWPTWIAACNIDAGAKLRAAVQPVSEAGQAHERHPQFHADVRRYLELVFALAADTLKTFARAKLDMGAVDFID